jgi:hypothetical protein
MARGWESKSVEAQQDEAGRTRGGRPDAPPSAADRARLDHRRGLELARARTLGDLAHARTPAQREMLERALADLEQMLGDSDPA